MIFFAGDVHGKFDHLLPTLQPYQGNEQVSVILLGDMQTEVPLEETIAPLVDNGIDVWFIIGNHDSDQHKYWDSLQDSWHRCLDGKVVNIQGVRVAGLGGVFRGETWYPDRNGNTQEESVINSYDDYITHLKNKTPPREHHKVIYTGRALKHRSSIFPDMYNSLAEQTADVLVTHEAPSCHPNGFATIDALAQIMGVKSLFHGHQHDNRDYSAYYDKLGFKPHGVGLRGISDIDGNSILAGELDYRRK